MNIISPQSGRFPAQAGVCGSPDLPTSVSAMLIAPYRNHGQLALVPVLQALLLLAVMLQGEKQGQGLSLALIAVVQIGQCQDLKKRGP